MKHLIYMIDGTWIFAGSAKADGQISNVYKLNMHLNMQDKDGNPQIIHYVRGLGGINGIRRYTSGGFSYGIEESIEDIYINICSNFEVGDKVYLFGFSRGAAVARAVTGLLSYGILQPDLIHYMPYLWRVYKANPFGRDPNMLDPQLRQSWDLISRHSRSESPVVDFLGVFDTVVGGMGRWRNIQKLNLHGMHIAPCVANAVHVLSLDETRGFFEPLVWKGQHSETTKIEQIWMPGVHSDVGGAYPRNYLGDASLIVMIDRIKAQTKLNLDFSNLNYLLGGAGPQIIINDEYEEALWKLFSPLKFIRRPGGFGQYVHPFADDLSQTAIKQKKSDERVPYKKAEETVPRSDYFKSRELRNKKIMV